MIANERRFSGRIDELERIHAPELLSGEANRRRLWMMYKSKSTGMGRQIIANGSSSKMFKHFKKLFSGSSREQGNGMSDDISVFSFTDHESNSDAAGVGIWICVWDVGDTGRV